MANTSVLLPLDSSSITGATPSLSRGQAGMDQTLENSTIDEGSPSVSQENVTIGASNVSNLHAQMGAPTTAIGGTGTASSSLSLRDMFNEPDDNNERGPVATTDNRAGPDSLDQNEYFDEGDSFSSYPKDGTVTPPDSLHYQPGPNSMLNKDSSLVVVEREHPQRLGAVPANSTTRKAREIEPSSMTPSSDSSTGDEWSKSRGSSPGNRAPVLYSAIGSLEDPSNGSFKWKPRNQIQKYEFPSGLLLPPGSAAKGPVSTINTAKAITVLEPQRRTSATQKPASGPNSANSSVMPDDSDKNGKPTDSVVQKINPSEPKKPSNLRSSKSTKNKEKDDQRDKKVKIADQPRASSKRKTKKQVEMFRPSSDAYTPRMGKKEIKYKPAEMRNPLQSSGLGTLSRPNFRDALRRVAMILRQHIVKIERRFEAKAAAQSGSIGTSAGRKMKSDKLFMPSMKEEFSEDRFITPTYKCTMVRVPMARSGLVYGLKQVRHTYEVPSEREIYDFAHRLFKTVQLSSECSIVCLIYVERLMEEGKVPLLASTWRPIMMTGLLLASKVWQDLSSWNIEFTNVYPQYSLEAIHRLEVKFLRILKWDLYISSSLYAKYYFALRALVERTDFRQRYNQMVGGVDNVQVQDALKVEERSTMVKEEALLQLSRSM